MQSEQCNQLQYASLAAARLTWAGALLTGLVGLAALSSCGTRSRTRVVSVHTLETAAPVEPTATRRAVLACAAELSNLYRPLNSRLGLFQIQNAAEWNTLQHCAPELGRCPDLSGGIVVGVVSRAGLPLNGTWPIHVQAARVHEGAGFVIAHFDGGSFLPDGTTYVETAQFNNLRAVLMVEVNGVRFYPD